MTNIILIAYKLPLSRIDVYYCERSVLLRRQSVRFGICMSGNLTQENFDTSNCGLWKCKEPMCKHILACKIQWSVNQRKHILSCKHNLINIFMAHLDPAWTWTKICHLCLFYCWHGTFIIQYWYWPLRYKHAVWSQSRLNYSIFWKIKLQWRNKCLFVINVTRRSMCIRTNPKTGPKN